MSSESQPPLSAQVGIDASSEVRGADIGILVRRHVEPGRARESIFREHAGHLSPAATSRELEMRHLGRNLRFLGDPEDFVQRLVDMLAFIAHVGGINPAVPLRRAPSAISSSGLRVARGRVLERGQTPRAPCSISVSTIAVMCASSAAVGSRFFVADDREPDLRRPDETSRC